jgi:hypothetical protein
LCSFFPSEAATSGLTSKPAAKSTELRFTIAINVLVVDIDLVMDDVRSSELLIRLITDVRNANFEKLR